MTWIIWLGIALGAIAAIAIGLTAYGAARWADATRTLLRRLEGARMPLTTSRYDVHELEGLPAPVQRYFRAVLKDGQPIITGVTVQHTGTFNVSADGERWMPFTSEQRVLTHRPGFVWNARMVIVPGIAVLVHDAYAAGVGTLHPAVLGLFSLTNQHGRGDIARGALIGGKVVMMPWEGRMSNYQERDGMRVPLTGEAAWVPPGVRKPYWRGTIVSMTYEFAVTRR